MSANDYIAISEDITELYDKEGKIYKVIHSTIPDADGWVRLKATSKIRNSSLFGEHGVLSPPSEPIRPASNVVNVNITGAVCSGKTTLASMLLEILLDNGFTEDNINIVNMDGDISSKHIDREACISAMKEKESCH